MPGGRPRTFKNPEEMENAFNDYIGYCLNPDNKVLLPNIAGFCRFLRIDKDTFYEYRNNHKEFSDCIKKIEIALEDCAIQCKDAPKSIFYLKNKFGYKDKLELENTTKDATNEADIDAMIEQKMKALGLK